MAKSLFQCKGDKVVKSFYSALLHIYVELNYATIIFMRMQIYASFVCAFDSDITKLMEFDGLILVKIFSAKRCGDIER